MHPLDGIVVVAYLAVVILIGYLSRRATDTEENFFLAGRKLGKWYQFFLTFGNATEPQGAVSTASLVYQRGAPGAWFTFQTVFMNPYYWFMNTWFRRVRLVTVADLFEDRLASRGLGVLYAGFQLGVACVLLGFGNFVVYKIASSLVLKPEAAWTSAERASVAGYHEWQWTEVQAAHQELSVAESVRLAELRAQRSTGALHTTITALPPLPFYIVFTAVIGTYIILGGMSAAAINEALQGILIIVFSLLLLPTGAAAIGGWGELAHKVPSRMFDLFASEGGSPLFVFAVMFTSLVQVQGMSQNMVLYGSARDEFSARMGGVAGNYGKRVMIILWAFAGLLAVALFGADGLTDPDAVWGLMSNRLLAPGLTGLMLAGVMAGTMSSFAAKSLAVSSLFARNVWRPAGDGRETVRTGRYALVAVLVLGVVAAELMRDFETVVKLLLTINVPFGAAIMLMFFWRRLTASAVWFSVVVSVLVIVVIPIAASSLPAVARAPALLQVTDDPSGRPAAVYFKDVVWLPAEESTSPRQGRGRFNVECWLLDLCGGETAGWSRSDRETAQFLFDGLLPFALMLVASLVTRPPPRGIVDQFYGKMKTPIGPTPELEAAAMTETRREPGRFDHTKLFPRSSWEFTRWNREDTLGFLTCCAVTAIIVGLFVLALKLAA